MELFSFVEATLIQYATIAGHFPSANASSVKAKPKRANKVEIPAEDSKVRLRQMLLCQLHQDQNPKAQPKNSAQPAHQRQKLNHPSKRREVRAMVKVSVDALSPDLRSASRQCIHFFRGTCQRGDQCKYEHQVGDDGQLLPPVPVTPEIIQRFEDAVKRYNETRAQAKPEASSAWRSLLVNDHS